MDTLLEEEKVNFDEAVDTVVVGAGPIGLLTAIGLKHQHPERNIVILEKYPDYKRKHTLIMESAHLQAFVNATGYQNAELLKLIERLKKDKHIRTSELQELLQKIAVEDLKIIKRQKEVKDIEQDIYGPYPNVNLLVGADGTKGIVSEKCFDKGNKVKMEIDFVLQVRYEIKNAGEVKNAEPKLPKTNAITMLSLMVNAGVLANEYIGHSDEKGVTPVTVQFMISKASYNKLKEFTSKKPLYPWKKNQNLSSGDWFKKISSVKDFIETYISQRTDSLEKTGRKITLEDVRISVNEAPVTHTKKIVNIIQSKPHIVLVGDAALGLSYFKGLNAGVEACAHLMEEIKKNKNNLEKALHNFEKWFENFATRKIGEVLKYSRKFIRRGMKAAKIAKCFKVFGFSNFSNYDASVGELNNKIKAFQQKVGVQFNEDNKNLSNGYPNYRRYPIEHQSYSEPDHFLRSLKATWKHFIDNFKPFKSQFYFYRDLRQPFTGFYHLGAGILKLLAFVFVTLWYLFTLKLLTQPKNSFKKIGRWLLDGLTRTFLGVYLLVTTLLLPVRLIFRLIASTCKGHIEIEKNRKLSQYVKKCKALLNNYKENKITIYAYCFDIHRKYTKQLKRNQCTDKKIELLECVRFELLERCNLFDDENDNQKAFFNQYLELFEYSVTRSPEKAT